MSLEYHEKNNKVVPLGLEDYIFWPGKPREDLLSFEDKRRYFLTSIPPEGLLFLESKSQYGLL